jgi:hypothetical protein
MHLHHKAPKSICEVTSCMRPTSTTYNKTGDFCYQHRTGFAYTRLGDLFDVDDELTADMPFVGTVNKDVKIKRIDTQENNIVVTVRICSEYMCTSPIMIRLRDTRDVLWSERMNRILNMEDVEEYAVQQKAPKKKPTTPKKARLICTCSDCTRPRNAGYGPSGTQCYRHRKRCQTPSSMKPGSRNSRKVRWDTCENDTECLDVTRPLCGKGGVCVGKR